MLGLYIIGCVFKYLLLTLLAVILAILLIPFRYGFSGENFSGEKDESSRFSAYVSWLFGGIKVFIKYHSGKLEPTIRFFGIHRVIKGNGTIHTTVEQAAPETHKKQKGSTVFHLNRGILEKAISCLLKLLNHCRPDKIRLKAKGGFEDPMYTGLMCAIQGVGFAVLDRYEIHLQPDFEDEELRGKLDIRGRIQLIYILLVALELLFSKPFRTEILTIIKTKMKRRIKRWQTLILRKT